MSSLHTGTKSDKDLLDAYRATGDQQFLASVFNRYSHLLFGTCMKYLKDEDAASDAVSDIYIHLVGKLREHEVTHFKSWIYTTTTNHCLMALRKLKRNPEVNLEEGKFYSEVMEKPGFGHLHEELEVSDADLHNAVASLGEGQQLCVQLFFLDGKSYREISAQTGFDEKQVKSHIQNGKRNLRLQLEKKLDNTSR